MAGVTYIVLPNIAEYLLKPELISQVKNNNLFRAVVSALGYQAIVRVKFFNINDTPIGIDALYDIYTKYFIKKMNDVIDDKIRYSARRLYQKFPNLENYEEVFNLRLLSMPDNKLKKHYEEKLKAILTCEQLSQRSKTKAICQLLIKICGSEQSLEKYLLGARNNELQPINFLDRFFR